ncbi:PREDICTED: uncharacterized protein LOC108760192 [Trachymyrmex cornetzi]|uniref:uncharacterized protein LOC108760192 n=1 Tax=Trachymyrmex cornetzi TaxID=471704 RepID=UPI00084EF60D|nr:PREDICTED: uncharacterized protein LOC108760192 [Trachymyrmex cornetzi]
MVATGTMLIAYLKHICGMFSIASFRIKKAMAINMQDVNEEKMVIIYKRIVSYNSIEQLVLPLMCLSALYIYMFLSNYTAQNITDHNEYVFATVYNVEWYMAPLQIQKIMLILLQKGTKAFHLMLGGIFIASMESAATLMGTSISYFTVLYSTSTK